MKNFFTALYHFMYLHIRALLFISLLFFAQLITSHSTIMAQDIASGMWHAELDLGEEILPFNLEVHGGLNTFRALQMTIINGDEYIIIDDIAFNDDGDLVADLPYFNSELVFNIVKGEMIGQWINYAKSEDYKLPFRAIPNEKRRFLDPGVEPITDLSGKWEVNFSPGTDDQYPAIGEFRQSGNYVSATFITETGDYRFLQGVLNGENLKLSAFDGAHAFLFTAKVEKDNKGASTIRGTFYSGSHWKEEWQAVENEKAILADPHKLTYLKEGFTTLEFSFPNAKDKMVSLADQRFKDKVVIIQVLGSWCPNCMDETRLYTRLYNNYCDDGLEIVGLAFEASDEKDKAWALLNKYADQMGIDYELLYAGKASKRIASEALPMLNKIISFPTSIIVDRSGAIRKIHTGFYGPATSEYDSYVKELEAFLKELLEE